MYEQASAPHNCVFFFGYGSLLWNPRFAFAQKATGYAHGFARRMFQGNIYHRGDRRQPGRVATLVQDENSFATGVVYKVVGEENIRQAFIYLLEREIANGYDFMEVTIELAESGNQIRAWTCIAHLDIEFYLGDADIEQMVGEIQQAKGYSGPNFEYVLKLAEQVRLLFPNEKDEHLF